MIHDRNKTEQVVARILEISFVFQFSMLHLLYITRYYTICGVCHEPTATNERTIQHRERSKRWNSIFYKFGTNEVTRSPRSIPIVRSGAFGSPFGLPFGYFVHVRPLPSSLRSCSVRSKFSISLARYVGGASYFYNKNSTFT